MKVILTYTKLVTEEFEVPDDLPKIIKEEDENYLEDKQKIINYIGEHNPSTIRGKNFKPAGVVDVIRIPKLSYLAFDVENIRFGGKW